MTEPLPPGGTVPDAGELHAAVMRARARRPPTRSRTVPAADQVWTWLAADEYRPPPSSGSWTSWP
ncbi:hypothetical protein [Streptomyces sp. NPDC048252]|uniref:hypothetical protein n=1 Tax=Streptomyces sp. NPDC048252 TaxID=3154612 RepID=UPI00343705E9